MAFEMAYPVTYPCPRCGVMLDAISDEWRDWLRCPSCGKAGRPPLNRRIARAVEDEVLYIGTFATSPVDGSPSNGSAQPWTPGMPTAYPAQGGTARRIILGGGFFLTAFLALVSVVQKNPPQAGVFGGAAVLLLFLLARSSARA